MPSAQGINTVADHPPPTVFGIEIVFELQCGPGCPNRVGQTLPQRPHGLVLEGTDPAYFAKGSAHDLGTVQRKELFGSCVEYPDPALPVKRYHPGSHTVEQAGQMAQNVMVRKYGRSVGADRRRKHASICDIRA